MVALNFDSEIRKKVNQAVALSETGRRRATVGIAAPPPSPQSSLPPAASPPPRNLGTYIESRVVGSFLLVKILREFVGTGEHTDAQHFFLQPFSSKNATTLQEPKEKSTYF